MRLPEIPLQAPYVLVDQATQTYFLYVDASSKGESGVAVYQSKDLRNWTGPTKVYAVPNGGWADPSGYATAPEVHLHAGRYFLFITLRNKKTIIAAAQQTPARATGTSIWQNQTARATVIAAADSPLGPFTTTEASSRITDASLMTLDGTLHTDPDGTPWMVFAQDWVQKIDGVMAAVKLKPGLTGPAAPPIWLFNGAQAPWYLDPQAGAPSGKPPANDLQFVPYAIFAPQVYLTPGRRLVMLWSGYRRHFTEFVQTQAISKTGNIAGPWEQLAPILAGNRGHGMLFEDFDGRGMMILHNNHGQRSASRAELHEAAITDEGIQVQKRRGDLDGVAG
jgi:Glycosyl hydrolases family 43